MYHTHARAHTKTHTFITLIPDMDEEEHMDYIGMTVSELVAELKKEMEMSNILITMSICQVETHLS